MAIDIDDEGNITLYKGDSGELVVRGLNTDKNYEVYFAIHDENRNLIGEELKVNSNKNPSVVFFLTPEYTDLLAVQKDEDNAIYYYGLKVCTPNGYEETLLVENSEIGALNRITVYPKKVEGIY